MDYRTKQKVLKTRNINDCKYILKISRSLSLASREMQIKATFTLHLTSRMVKLGIQMTTNLGVDVREGKLLLRLIQELWTRNRSTI